MIASVSLPSFAQSDTVRARMQYEQQQREYWHVQEQQRQPPIYDE